MKPNMAVRAVVSTPSQRQKKLRSRIMALAVIVAVGASAGTVQAFNSRQHADAASMWTSIGGRNHARRHPPPGRAGGPRRA
ncbi:hypothetical protein ACRAWD_07355 [Caulobacter segnis]